ncbi:uncharacterized protein VTP21DRAFT_9201 [Calcarisporiella thermophila]|uniref:uncharacterized protein n=1 Tax=Calcarisporiella thermophila TaxID=911321 RepID=UPI003742FABF
MSEVKTTPKSPPMAASEGRSISSNFSQIDYTDFLSDNFDLRTWINDALSAVPISSTSAQLSRSGSTLSLPEAEEFLDPSSESKSQHPQSQTSSQGEDMVEGVSLEQHATMIVMRLQLLSKEVTERLTQQTGEIFKNMPRVMYDLQRMKEEARRLGGDIEKVQGEIGKIEQGTEETVQRLKVLDQMLSQAHD